MSTDNATCPLISFDKNEKTPNVMVWGSIRTPQRVQKGVRKGCIYPLLQALQASQ